MKNYLLVVLVACVAFVTLAAIPGHAQALIKADVPFDFTAAHGVLPAGAYSIAHSTRGQFLVLSSGLRFVEIIMWNTAEWRTDFGTTKLVFHRYGDQYFLAEIWSGMDSSVRKLVVHPRERQLMVKQGMTPQTAVVYGVADSRGGN